MHRSEPRLIRVRIIPCGLTEKIRIVFHTTSVRFRAFNSEPLDYNPNHVRVQPFIWVRWVPLSQNWEATFGNTGVRREISTVAFGVRSEVWACPGWVANKFKAFRPF